MDCWGVSSGEACDATPPLGSELLNANHVEDDEEEYNVQNHPLLGAPPVQSLNDIPVAIVLPPPPHCDCLTATASQMVECYPRCNCLTTTTAGWIVEFYPRHALMIVSPTPVKSSNASPMMIVPPLVN